jgi:23S rRNA pseudouridine1911/1915/1917 synthase
MMTDNIYTVTEDDAGLRLDKLITLRFPEISRSQAARLIDDGQVEIADVNKNTVKKASKKTVLSPGDTIKLTLPEPVMLEASPQNIPLDIVFEDDSLVIVNKPKGMVVHPAPGNPDGTLVNALLYHCKLSTINGVVRPGIVHRIDKNTSGLLVVAKTDFAHQKLAAQIKDHSFTREYLAVCDGGFREDAPIVNVTPLEADNYLHGFIDAPIGRSPQNRKKMCVIDDPKLTSRAAKTEYTVIDSHDNHAFLRLKLFTGRTHQIRVHLSYIGRPVFGDEVYGREQKIITGQCLHAAKLGFIHPTSGDYMEYSAPLPDWFERVLKKFGLQSNPVIYKTFY